MILKGRGIFTIFFGKPKLGSPNVKVQLMNKNVLGLENFAAISFWIHFAICFAANLLRHCTSYINITFKNNLNRPLEVAIDLNFTCSKCPVQIIDGAISTNCSVNHAAHFK